MSGRRGIVAGVFGPQAARLDYRATAMPDIDFTVWFLEMTDPAQRAPAPDPDPALEVRRVERPAPEFARMLYAAIGAEYHWTDRLSWTWQQWHDRLARDGVELWVGYLDGAPAGCSELDRNGDAVELRVFGLLPDFTGRGLGPRLLDHAIRRAWDMGAERVWLHTCSLDSPAALATYQRRGFQLYDEHHRRRWVDDDPGQPWPGAQRPRLQPR
jgi:GNAT superfamily N-acetyltransferase